MTASPHIPGPLRLREAGVASSACACCGKKATRVWGRVVGSGGDDGGAGGGERHVCLYFASFVVEDPEHEIEFTLIFGPWAEGEPEDRHLGVALRRRMEDGEWGLLVVDDAATRKAGNDLAAHFITPAEVAGTAFGDRFFAALDTVMSEDGRLSVLRERGAL